jgi:hypothetical protein
MVSKANAVMPLPGWLKIVTAGQLIHMLSHNSNRHFLVDADASYRILPHQSSLPATGLRLCSLAGLSPVLAGEDALYSCAFRIRFFLEISSGQSSFPHQKLLAAPHMPDLTRWWPSGRRPSSSKLATGRKSSLRTA